MAKTYKKKYIKRVYVRSEPNKKYPDYWDNLWAYHYQSGAICGSWFGPSKVPRGFAKQTGKAVRPPMKLRIENGKYVEIDDTYWWEGSKKNLGGSLK
jgi:hypothetical protein